MKIKGEGFYLSCKKYGENSFIIYIFSKKNGLIKGVIGQNMSVEDGYRAAQNCGLSLLAQLNAAISGDFQKFKSSLNKNDEKKIYKNKPPVKGILSSLTNFFQLYNKLSSQF